MMDGFREHPNEFDTDAAISTPAADDVSAAIGTDERRMHVRAYNYWVSLLEGRDFPSIEDLEPANVEDFATHSLLLDFTCGHDNPAMPYVGVAIRDECGLNEDMRTTADVPSRSLLSRLTDHYLQIIANRAPIGFEAEFVNQRGDNICYRGILMPFSSDGDTIDFIYGVINWKQVGEEAAQTDVVVPCAGDPALDEVPEEREFEALPELLLGEAEPEVTEFGEEQSPTLELTTDGAVAPEAAPVPHFSWEDGPLAADEDDDGTAVPEIALGEDAALADRLWAARETAEAVKLGEGRTRAALYKALSLAFDFSLAAASAPADYAELLEESGMKAQARAPMTPVVKLVFGIDYDKARLTEYAAALSFGPRQGLGIGEFESFIEAQAGGLKALVAAERQARRPEHRADMRGEVARDNLRQARPIAIAELRSDSEFAVVVTRRGTDGQHQVVAILEDEALAERVIRSAA
jgi:hypothetical protein